MKSVQYQAALAITSAWQGTNRIRLYQQLGLESLSDRRSLNRVIQLFKIKNDLTPIYLKRKLPLIDIQAALNDDILPDKVTRTQKYQNSFFPDAVSSWNSLIGNVQGGITKANIKSHIIKIIRPRPKSIYNIHDPLGLHYLFQLRTGLSPLRSHKFSHNFQDTPTNICSCTRGVEDENHFLFECLLFANHRVTLAANVTNLLTRNYLADQANNIEIYLYGQSRHNSVDKN